MASREILQPRSRISLSGRQQAIASSTSTQARSNISLGNSQPKTLDQFSLEDRQRIHAATTMSEENEFLIWASFERNESLPQTKLHFERAMLLIDSDNEEQAQKHGDDEDTDDDDKSSKGGSIEWEETAEPDSEDERRLQPGNMFGPNGWWNPKIHKNAEDRIEQDRERHRLKAMEDSEASNMAKVKIEDRTPERRRRSAGGKGSGRRRSSGRMSLDEDSC